MTLRVSLYCSAPAEWRGRVSNAGHLESSRNERHPLGTIAIQATPGDDRADARVTTSYIGNETDRGGNRKKRRAGCNHFRVSHAGFLVGEAEWSQPKNKCRLMSLPIARKYLSAKILKSGVFTEIKKLRCKIRLNIRNRSSLEIAS
jgi:hypothetical protein